MLIGKVKEKERNETELSRCIFLKLQLQGVLGAIVDDTTLVDVYYAPPILYLPKQIEHIGTSCFSGQNDLREITLPKGMQEVSNLVFTNCKNLEKIIIPEGLLPYKNLLTYCNNARIEVMK